MKSFYQVHLAKTWASCIWPEPSVGFTEQADQGSNQGNSKNPEQAEELH